MLYHESVEFRTYKNKKFIIEFKIESSSYDRFESLFQTDKYINLVQWEYIMSKLKRAVLKVTKNRNRWENQKNRFTIDDLIISFEFVNKAEGVINYEKIKYEFDWIIKVTINKSSTIQDSCNVQESQTSTSSPRKRSSSSSKESNAQNDENLVIDDDDEHIHENKKAKIDEDDLDAKSSVLQQSNRYNLKSRGEKSKQSSITNWVTDRKEKTKPQKSKEPKEPIPSTSKDALAQINKEKLQQMNEFVTRAEQEEQKMLQRKEELKDYIILNCHDMTNDEIIEIIKDLDVEINYLFENESELLASRNSAKINPCDITASNILSEKQTMFVLRTIEKEHTMNGNELCDNTLHNVALPRVIIELFKKHHKLKTDEAVERIKTQEERKILFKEEFNESY